MAQTTSLPWDVEKRLQQVLENASLTPLYRSEVHENKIGEIFKKCTNKGPTVTVLYCYDHIWGFLMPNNFWTNRNIAPSTPSLFFSFNCNKDMEMSTEILNIKRIKVDEDNLTLYSFDDMTLIALYPSKKKYILCYSLSMKTSQRCMLEATYCECEVFRVEEIKVKNGFISKITRATQHRQCLLEELTNYKVYGNLFSEIRILLLGAVGSGKSSFYNSVKSIFQGHMTRQAPVGSDIRSITEQYRTYSIKNGIDGKSLPFMLCDSMGLHDTDEAGLCIEDIPHILKGNMPDRYMFNPCKPITPQHPTFITSPSLKGRIHCVAYVFDINSIINLSSKMIATFKKIQREVLNHGIPLMVLITKVENYGDILQDDLLNMNELSEEKVIQLTKTLNIPSFTILMVQNYASELELYPLKDIVILTALRQMLRAANAALEDLPLEKPEQLDLPVSTFSESTIPFQECEVFRYNDVLGKRTLNRISGHRKKLLDDMRTYKPYGNLVHQIRILLLGPSGAGKSSFVNSVKSVFRGHVIHPVFVGFDKNGMTETFRTYTINDGKVDKPMPFILCDSMGLDEENGICMNDITNILKGHVSDRYQLNPVMPITPDNPNYINDPSLKDRIHCVAFMFNVNSVDQLSEKMIDKIKIIQRELIRLGVVHIAVLTNVDKLDSITKSDFLDIYKCAPVKSKLGAVHDELGIALSDILVVSNYSNTSEWELDPFKDILILSVLRQLLWAANDFLEDLPHC